MRAWLAAALALYQTVALAQGVTSTPSIQTIGTPPTPFPTPAGTGYFRVSGPQYWPMTNDDATGVVYKFGAQYDSHAFVANVTERFFHNYRPPLSDGANLFVGTLAGNFTMAFDGGAIGDPLIQTAYNVGVGTQSLGSLTTGYNNACFGVNACRYVTQGFSNVLIGRDAGENQTIGIYNVAVGQSAINTNTTGNYNTAIGGLSFYNAAASNNTGLGYNAGYDVTIGTQNTFIGYNTGLGVTTGGKNTVIGALVTGLTAGLANNVILADGDGVIRYQVNANGLQIVMPTWSAGGAGPQITQSATAVDSTTRYFTTSAQTAGWSIGLDRPGDSVSTTLVFASLAGAWTNRMSLTAGGALAVPLSVNVGGATLTLTQGALGVAKITASASAPGAGGGKLEMVCGTNAGTAKIIAYAGSSATPATLLDNIGAGVTGC